MNLSINEAERRILLRVLFAYPLHNLEKVEREEIEHVIDVLMERDCRAVPSPAVPADPPNPSTPSPDIPENAEMLSLTPIGFSNVLSLTPIGSSNAKGRLTVSYHPPEGGARMISCWKPEIFDAIRARLNKPTTFYVVTKGQYKNIVGVKQP